MFIPDPDFSMIKKALAPGSGPETLTEINVSNPVGLNADPDPATYLNADRIHASKTESVFPMPIRLSQEDQHAIQYMLTKECPVHQAGRVLLNRVKNI